MNVKLSKFELHLLLLPVSVITTHSYFAINIINEKVALCLLPFHGYTGKPILSKFGRMIVYIMKAQVG